MNIVLFWFLILLWAVNLLASIYAGRIRIAWINMQKWLLQQHEILKESPDFQPEAMQVIEIGQEINQWTDQSLKLGAFLLISAQVLIVGSAINLLLLGTLYIPTVVALMEATAILFVWITYQRYVRSKGMCYAVQVHVNAALIFDEHTESDNGSQPGTIDSRRDERDSDFRRRKDDGA